MKEELLKGLSEEQIAKVKACKNTEEMLAVAKEEGIELTDDQLEAVSGGACTQSISGNRGKSTWCPQCKTQRWCLWLKKKGLNDYFRCTACGHEFWW